DVVCWGEMDGAHTIGQHVVGDSIGDDPGEMGSALVPVNLGPGHAVTDLSVSSTHACAIREDHSLVCWGENNDAQLGSETSVPAGLSAPLPDDHPAVDLGTGRTARALATGGYHHTCALLDDDTVKCWGDNQRGTLGTGDVLRRGDEPGEMGDGLLPAALGPGRTVRDIALGDFHACAVLDDATVKCWGENQRGQLGIGDTFDRGDEPDELGDQLPAVDLGTPPDAPSLTVELTANREEVRVGHPIRYEVTVTNTGNVDLSGVEVLEEPGAPTCGNPFDRLPPGASAEVNCRYSPSRADVGTYTYTAVATSDQTGPVPSNPVDVTVLPVLDPDLALKLAGQAFIGVGVPGPGPVGQTIPITRSRGSATTFFVRVENAGQAADRFDLVRVDSSPGVGVRYFRGRTATELTDVIRRGSYLTRLLEPGETVRVRLEVTVGRRVPHGAQRTVTLRSHPGTDPDYAADTVRIALRIR
ncbi:MAG TPA: hypothetical protein PKA98_11660, partial [Acidimicrobiales bacterium]|nr:hypothetical protein [Acidimicrobiales bacterium]